MKWPGVAINTAMLAAAIGIDARLEADVRALVVSDDAFGTVLEKLRARERVFLGIPILIAFEMDLLEAIRRILCRAAMRGNDLFGLHAGILAQRARARFLASTNQAC